VALIVGGGHGTEQRSNNFSVEGQGGPAPVVRQNPDRRGGHGLAIVVGASAGEGAIRSDAAGIGPSGADLDEGAGRRGG
jgi:hypothetical protein